MTDHTPATLNRIANVCGVSMTTVSKILRGQYKGTTRKGIARVAAVKAAVEKYGYMANASARRLRGGQQRAIAVLLPGDKFDQPTFFSFEFITGMSAVLGPLNHSISILTYPRDQRGAAMHRLSHRTFDGMAVLDDTTPEIDAFLAAAKIPTVYINTGPAADHCVLLRDEYGAARAVVEALAGRGYRKLQVIGGRGLDLGPFRGHFSKVLRGDGIRDAAAAADLVCTYDDTPDWHPDFTGMITSLVLEPDTVVLATNSNALIQAIRFLSPTQPVACCDEVHLFALMPWLTRATFDRAAIGRRAAEILLRRLKDPQTAIASPEPLPAQVLVGDSTPSRQRRLDGDLAPASTPRC